MVEKISNYIVDNVLYKNEEVDTNTKEVMLFGVTRIVEDIPKYLLITVICALLGILKEAGIVLVVTVLYKTFVGGAHARTNFGCFISSLMFFILPVLISKYVSIPNDLNNILYILVYIFSLYVVVKIAPADTEEIPILNKAKKRQLKIFGFVFLCLIYIVTLFFIQGQVYKNIIVLTLFIIDLMATKPIYKFYRCKYSYESDEFKEYYKKNYGMDKG